MQTTELKSILIAKINKIEDNHLLMEASRLINIEIPAEEEARDYALHAIGGSDEEIVDIESQADVVPWIPGHGRTRVESDVFDLAVGIAFDENPPG